MTTATQKCPRCGSDTCPGRDAILDCTALIDGLSAREEAIKALVRLGPYMDAIDTVEAAARMGNTAVVAVRKDGDDWSVEPQWPTRDSERLRLARATVIDAGYFTADEVGDDVAPRIAELLFAIRDGKFDVRGAFGRDPETDAAPAAYLTPAERKALDLTRELWHALTDIAGDGRTRDADLSELATKIHDIQNTVLAQAGARAYPDSYRLLGGTLSSRDDS